MKKVWIRLGGYVSADEETMKKVMVGDEDALLKAIKENGFELNGESYIPINGDEDVIESFDISPTKLFVIGDEEFL